MRQCFSLPFQVRCLLCIALPLAFATVQPAFAEGDKSPDVAGKISEIWSQTVPIEGASPDKVLGRWRVWVEAGWLVAERCTTEGAIEWKIVLAKVAGDEPPEIIANREMATLRLNYGRYFIYDFSRGDGDTEVGCLRCRRQRKTEEERGPAVQAPQRDGTKDLAFSSRADGWSLEGRVIDSWLTVTAGPHAKGKQRFADCLVRVFHTDLNVAEHGGSGGGDSLYQHYGKWFVEDDGEILMANRLEERALPDELAFRAKSDPALATRLAMRKLADAPAPELSGDGWLNTDKPPTLKSLRGKPVLLVLFDLRQRSFLPLAASLQTFHDSYDKQGLAVIGVYAPAPQGEIAQHLAEERITFPVLIDNGKTTARYGLGYSASVLIDRDGKVASVYKGSLAPPAEIERLLDAVR